MINVRSDKEFNLDFKMNIEGTEKAPQVRFVFEMENGIHVSFPGQYIKAENTVQVSLPSLDSIGIFEKRENLNAKLEVIVENNYFTPWEDIISIKHPVHVSAEAYENQNTKPLQETVTSVENSPEIHYKEEHEEKFSPVEKLRNIKKKNQKVFTEETINGVLYRKIK